MKRRTLLRLAATGATAVPLELAGVSALTQLVQDFPEPEDALGGEMTLPQALERAARRYRRMYNDVPASALLMPVVAHLRLIDELVKMYPLKHCASSFCVTAAKLHCLPEPCRSLICTNPWRRGPTTTLR